MMNEKVKNTLLLLANGFFKASSSSSAGFNYVRGAASSLAASAGNVVSGSNSGNNSSNSSGLKEESNGGSNSLASSMSETNQSSIRSGSSNQLTSATSSNNNAPQVNREIRIGVTYAYVELASLLGQSWLERNLKLYLTHVLGLVNNTKAVGTHLDAVYSRKCVQFILRSIVGGMLNEKVQLQAARELVNVIDKCVNGAEISDEKTNSKQQPNTSSQQHVLICALYELSCILKCLNTSASILIDDGGSLKLIDKVKTRFIRPETH